MAISTLNAVDTTDTIRLFMKYRASGTVLHMSMNGLKVGWVGHQGKSPCTSPSGLIDEVTMTYSGTSVNRPRTTTTTTLNKRNERGSCTTTPAVGDEQIGAGDHEQEQQQQHRHRRSEAEVPVDERVVVDVDRDQVRGRRWRRPEEDEGGVEVVEGPQEQHQDENDVDRPQHAQGDVPQLLPDTRAVHGRGLVDLVWDGLHPRHDHQEGCLLYTSPSPRDRTRSRMPSSA